MTRGRTTATARSSAVASGGASEEKPALSVVDARSDGERYVNCAPQKLPKSWLRTGADRLVPVPLDLLPWRGPESRATFKRPQDSDVQPVVRRGRGS